MKFRPGKEPVTWSEGNKLVTELGSEDYLAARITAERESRGWSQSELARQLQQRVGASIHQTAISKIEKPRNGRRAITVDEAIAFAKVFDIPLGELLLPPESMRHISIARGLAEGPDLLGEHLSAESRYRGRVRDLAGATAADPYWAGQLADQLEAAIRQATERGTDPDDSVKVLFLRDVLELRSRLRDALDEPPKRRAVRKGKR